MNENKKNLRGFTLVELLAVIVVLAIVMLIAVNAVLPQMERARRSSFAIEANGAIDAANAYFMNSSLTTGNTGFPTAPGGSACVTIDTLRTGGYSDLSSEYTGSVKVTKSTDPNSNLYFFEVWIKKGDSMMIIDKGANSGMTENVAVEEGDVEGYDATKWSSSNPTTCGVAGSGGTGS